MKKNILYISLLVVVLALQLMILFVFIYQFIPIHTDAIAEGVPPKLAKLFLPNRNHFFYHIFVFSSLIGQAIFLYIFRRRLNSPALSQELKLWLGVEVFWLAWILFGTFKFFQYQGPLWSRILFDAGLAAAILGKIYWAELSFGLQKAGERLQGKIPVRFYHGIDGLMVVLIMAIITIPHPAQFGAGAHWIKIFCLAAIAYYTIFYFFFRYWLGLLPAVFATVLAIKLQMFNASINPLIWYFPQQTILRHCPDLLEFFCLLAYARRRKESFLWLAAAVNAAALCWVVDTGLCLLAAFYSYIAVLLSFKHTREIFCPSPSHWRKILGLMLLPWPLVFWLHGPMWFVPQATVSIFSCLKDRNFFAFFSALSIPLVYGMGMVVVIHMMLRRQWDVERLFLISLGVYGLGIYGLFMQHAVMDYYYLAPLPLAGFLTFFGREALAFFKPEAQRNIKLALVLAVMAGLFTDIFFVYYPNIFNLAHG